MKIGTPTEIDPRFSFPGFIAICTAAFVFSGSSGAMLFLLGYVGVLFILVFGFNAFGRHMLRITPVVALIVLLNGMLTPGTALVSAAGFDLFTWQGITAGFFYSFRFMVLYFLVVFFVGVTPPERFAGVLYKVFRPFSRNFANGAAFYAFNVLSFLPLFTDEIERIRLAQSFRGAELKGGLIRRVLAVRLLVVPLVVSAVHRSGQLAATVELRGLRSRLGEALPSSRPTRREFVFALTTVVVLVAAVLVFRSGAV
jgi:energy-coupling factor transport system permease protein